MTAFMQLLLLVLLLLRGACTSPVAVCIFCIVCIFYFYFFHTQITTNITNTDYNKHNNITNTDYNKHNNVVLTTFKLVETYQAYHAGDDNNRRRKSDWADWTHKGLPDAVEEIDDDYHGDNPEIWLKRAKKFGFASEKQWELRKKNF